MKTPCYNCQSRFVGCHSKCPTYKVWHNKQHKAKKLRRKEVEKEILIRDYKMRFN